VVLVKAMHSGRLPLDLNVFWSKLRIWEYPWCFESQKVGRSNRMHGIYQNLDNIYYILCNYVILLSVKITYIVIKNRYSRSNVDGINKNNKAWCEEGRVFASGYLLLFTNRHLFCFLNSREYQVFSLLTVKKDMDIQARSNEDSL